MCVHVWSADSAEHGPDLLIYITVGQRGSSSDAAGPAMLPCVLPLVYHPVISLLEGCCSAAAEPRRPQHFASGANGAPRQQRSHRELPGLV